MKVSNMNDDIIIINAKEASVSSGSDTDASIKNMDEILLPISNILYIVKNKNGSLNIWLRNAPGYGYLFIGNPKEADSIYTKYKSHYMPLKSHN